MNANITTGHHFITVTSVVGRFLMVGEIVEQKCTGAFGPWLTQITGAPLTRECDGALIFPATNQFGGLETFEVRDRTTFVPTWDIIA